MDVHCQPVIHSCVSWCIVRGATVCLFFIVTKDLCNECLYPKNDFWKKFERGNYYPSIDWEFFSQLSSQKLFLSDNRV